MAVAPLLRQVLATAASRHVVIDLRQATFLDSTGLAALVECWRAAPPVGGWLRLVGPSGAVLRVLQITGVDQVLPIHDTVDEALRLRAVEGDGVADHAADHGAGGSPHGRPFV